MRTTSDFYAPCRTMGELGQCLSAPSHCVPTVEFTVRNMDLPLSKDDYDFLNADEINFFATSAAAPNTKVASSRNLTDTTLTFDVPFILLGLCVYAYAEPYAITLEGNEFFSREAIGAWLAAGNDFPASPMNLRDVGALLGGLFGAPALPAGVTVRPSKVEHGGAAWRAIWAFMHSRRLVMRCPSSSYDILMDEALADIGNCCSQSEFGGFGSSKAAPLRIVKALNERFAEIGEVVNENGVTQESGYFFPINSEQDATGEIVPQRYAADLANYGRPLSMPTVEQWYRLPCPIPFPAIPQPKIKISLVKENGDDPYHQRMLKEMTYLRSTPLGDILGAATPTDFYLNEPPAAPGDRGFAEEVLIPSGKIRYGIGLKGFEVRGSVCDQLMGMLEGKTFAEAIDGNEELKAYSQKRGIQLGCK